MPAFPAARIGDTVSHDLIAPSGVISTPLTGPCPKGMVVIEGLPAAHVNCTVLCLGTTAAGVIPSPLHTAPAPVVAPGTPGGSGASGAGGNAGSGPSTSGEGLSGPSPAESTEFTLQVLGGWTGSASLPLGKITKLPVPEPGARIDHLVVRIEDSQGNAAIYEYYGAGDTIGWGDTFSGGEFAAGDPVPFHTHSPYTVEEFAGKARLNSAQHSATPGYGFKFGPPKDGGIVWNDDFFRDAFGKFGPAPPPFFKWQEYEVEMEDFDLQHVDKGLSRPALTLEDSEGQLTLKKVIPKPPPTPAVPVLLPVPSTNPIILGSRTVFIHGMPAVRWAPSGDSSACLALLGDVKLLGTRTVWLG